MLAWAFGVELGLSGGGPLSPTCVNLLKKFGACKTSWEFYEKVIFGLISTVRIQIWPRFVQENSRSWVINLVCLLVRNCTRICKVVQSTIITALYSTLLTVWGIGKHGSLSTPLHFFASVCRPSESSHLPLTLRKTQIWSIGWEWGRALGLHAASTTQILINLCLPQGVGRARSGHGFELSQRFASGRWGQSK